MVGVGAIVAGVAVPVGVGVGVSVVTDVCVVDAVGVLVAVLVGVAVGHPFTSVENTTSLNVAVGDVMVTRLTMGDTGHGVFTRTLISTVVVPPGPTLPVQVT